MKTYTFNELIEHFGDQHALASLCNVTQGRISQMKQDGKLSTKAARSLIKKSGLTINQIPMGF